MGEANEEGNEANGKMKAKVEDGKKEKEMISSRETSLKTAAILLASGIDPSKSTLFLQSSAPVHTELMWLFSTLMPLTSLQKMPLLKEQTSGKGD